MSKARAWLQAARPLAQANLATPLLCGAALGWTHAPSPGGDLHPAAFVGLGLVFTVVAQPCIVFLNDLHDAEGDALHPSPTPFSGGSRVLVEGRLTPGSLRRGLYLCAGMLLGISAIATILFDRPWTPAFALLTLLLSWLYSATPVRGCATRLGPWLQALGTGAVLPVLGGYLLTGDLTAVPTRALLALVLLGAANHILTTLPDRRADLLADKRTYATRHGPLVARRHAMQMVLAVIGLSPWVLSFEHAAAVVGVMGICAGLVLSGLPLLRREDVEHRAATLAFVVLLAGSIQLLMLGWAGVSLLP